MGRIGILNPKILRIPNLGAFLETWGEPAYFGRLGLRREFSAIAGWGYKPTADRARAEAVRLGLPYLGLEDGFLRSIGLGVAGAPPWSIVVDDLGMYYDCSAPSRLEALITEDIPSTAETTALIATIRSAGLSKYNDAPDLRPELLPDDGRPLVIALDQTLGDVSVSAGGADQDTFESMLEAAITENPGARVVLRRHPDVVAGLRKGYLDRAARSLDVEIFAHPAGFPSLARRAARIYTVTSLGGMEALIAGVPVTCFGLPFYAGWGLTDDRAACPRRAGGKSLAGVVEAAYRRYARYVDPIDGSACDALIVARHIAERRRR